MNCYEFEQNISAYIDGEIKKIKKKIFIAHKEQCLECSQKIDDISTMINSFHSLKEIKTSPQFETILRDKIIRIQNRRHGLWHKLLNFKPFGYEPLPAFGLSLAFLMILGSSYVLINQDGLPEVNVNRVTNNKIPSKFSPSVELPVKESHTLADEDSSIYLKKNKRNNSIRLVGGK